MSRKCGDCTLCCTLLAVVDLGKPVDTACVHCSKGCSIYEKRPEECRTYECLWLGLPQFPKHLKPNKTHVMFDVTTDGKTMVAHVDTRFPNAWRERKVRDFIDHLVNDGRDVIIIVGAKRLLRSRNPATIQRFQHLGGEIAA